MTLIFSQTAVRVRATRFRDEGGTLTPQSDWANADRLDLVGVSIQPAGTSEDRDPAGVGVTEQWRLISRRGTDVDLIRGDRIEWNGHVLDLIGEPQRWPALSGTGVHHVEALLRDSPPTRQASTGLAGVLHDAVSGATNAQRGWSP